MSCHANAPKGIVDALGGNEPTCQQWAAISHPLEPVALIAGAGSGKTAVMAARIVWIVLNSDVRASEILGLTFTNKAAENLAERVRRAIEPLGMADGEEPTVLTYHAFAARLIVDHGMRAGLEPDAALLTEAQAWQLCAEMFQSRRFERLEVRTLYHVSWVRQLADDCANHLREPREVIEHDLAFLERIRETGVKISAKARDSAAKRIELAGVVADYTVAKRLRHALDYGDQIRFAYLLALDEQVAEEFRARYRVALLDEYQDTNVAQAKMLKALMPDGYPVTAVGDPDQNIYAWRGASLHNLLAFAGQFPTADGSPAAVRPLETNFRSGRRILDLANALIERVPEARRPPDKVLRPYPPLGDGEVAAFLATDQVAEAERIAAEAVAAHEAATPWREVAVLCRKKRLIGPVVEALRERDVPVEVIGLGGLLEMPEIVDLVSLLRVLEDPMSNVALARLLRGPRWRIGHRDVALIARHAAAKNRRLAEELPGEVESPGDVAFSLAEALGDLGEIQGISAAARSRLEEFNAVLAALRAQAHLPLPDLAARALDALGLVRELDASPTAGAPAIRRNVASFLDRVAAFSPVDGEPTLAALIEWLDAVDESAEEIEASPPGEDDSVKVMTIHQAKGLEFDVVFVPGLARGERSRIFPDTARQANPITQPRHLPFELRGDNAVLPRFDGNLSKFSDELRDRAMEEERRLLYVACTRARRRLVCSAAHWYFASGMREDLKTPMGPSEFFEEIAEFPEADVTDRADRPGQNPLVAARGRRAAEWPRAPRREPDELFPEGYAAAVGEARAAAAGEEPGGREPTPPGDAGRPGGSPRALPATGLVTYARCPKKFYWTSVRPLPVRPSPAARIGTIVHGWIEQRATRPPRLIELEEVAEPLAPAESARVGALKASFAGSRFDGRVPVAVEQPFALVVGDFVVRGKIDAIFEREGGGWEIVDWKTGAAPDSEGEEWVQLDLYALAAQEVWGKSPGDVTVTFVYLGGAGEGGAAVAVERSRPASPAVKIHAELEERLRAIDAGEFAPSPGSWCGYCDFRRFCPEGAQFLGG